MAILLEAIKLLEKVHSMYGIIDPITKCWCSKKLIQLRQHLAERRGYWPYRDDAYFFGLISIYFD